MISCFNLLTVPSSLNKLNSLSEKLYDDTEWSTIISDPSVDFCGTIFIWEIWAGIGCIHDEF